MSRIYIEATVLILTAGGEGRFTVEAVADQVSLCFSLLLLGEYECYFYFLYDILCRHR